MKFLAIFVTCCVIYGCSEEVDYEYVKYCEMVGIWKDQELKGVPEIDRSGWPPYKGDC